MQAAVECARQARVRLGAATGAGHGVLASTSALVAVQAASVEDASKTLDSEALNLRPARVRVGTVVVLRGRHNVGKHKVCPNIASAYDGTGSARQSMHDHYPGVSFALKLTFTLNPDAHISQAAREVQVPASGTPLASPPGTARGKLLVDNRHAQTFGTPRRPSCSNTASVLTPKKKSPFQTPVSHVWTAAPLPLRRLSACSQLLLDTGIYFITTQIQSWVSS